MTEQRRRGRPRVYESTAAVGNHLEICKAYRERKRGNHLPPQEQRRENFRERFLTVLPQLPELLSQEYANLCSCWLDGMNYRDMGKKFLVSRTVIGRRLNRIEKVLENAKALKSKDDELF